MVQSKIPSECIKSLALGCYSQDFTKYYRVVFEESSLYFTSHLKISKYKSNNKTPQNPFNFDSLNNSFWIQLDSGIRRLFTKFYKRLSSSSWKMLTLLHLPSPLWKFPSPTKCNRHPPPPLPPPPKKKKNPYNFDSIKYSFWLHVVNGI